MSETTEVTDTTCPACGESIERYGGLGPATVLLRPCGHQVDQQLFAELTGSRAESAPIRATRTTDWIRKLETGLRPRRQRSDRSRSRTVVQISTR